MQIGVDSFAAAISDPVTGLTLSPVDRVQHLLEEIKLADQVGLDVFGIGEHHRAEFLDSAPVVILAAAAALQARMKEADELDQRHRAWIDVPRRTQGVEKWGGHH